MNGGKEMDVMEKLVELMADFYGCDPMYYGVDALSIAQYLIAHGVTVQEWVSVTDERKPKDRINYFIAYVFGDSDMHFFGEAKYYAYDGNGIVDRPHFSNEGVEGMRVTHWMEIPKLPQQPKGE